MFIISILLTIFILGLIIFIHEFGHFITAKLYKMPVLEFAIGMGPKVFSKKINGTAYSIRALPIGGFVNIDGMATSENEEEKVKGGFASQSVLHRFVVLVAGAAFNFVSSIIAIFILFSLSGNIKPVNYSKPVIDTVMEGSISVGHLQTNDEILEIQNKEVESISGVIKTLTEEKSKKESLNEVTLKIKRGTEIKDISIKSDNIQQLGIAFKSVKMGFLGKVRYSVQYFVDIVISMLEGIWQMITGKVKLSDMTGPVGLPKMVGEVQKTSGFIGLLGLFVFLSINIGLINLLPIPALDGGRTLFVILEMFKIKVNKKIEEKLHFVGIALLLALMFIIIISDFRKYM